MRVKVTGASDAAAAVSDALKQDGVPVVGVLASVEVHIRDVEHGYPTITSPDNKVESSILDQLVRQARIMVSVEPSDGVSGRVEIGVPLSEPARTKVVTGIVKAIGLAHHGKKPLWRLW